MVRELLGNIKGPRGFEGPKGEDGGFNGETFGVNNLINLSELTPFDSNTNIEIDIENGVINYSNSSYYMRHIKTLRKGNYTFIVKDYTSHSDSFGGRLRFQVVAVDGSGTIFSNDVVKGETYSFNVVVDKECYIELRASGGTRKDGFIEKPMLVEGDYSALWNISETDKSYTKPMASGRLIGSLEQNTEVDMSIYGFNTNGDYESTGTSIIMETGTHIFNGNFFISFGDDKVEYSMYLNDTRISRNIFNANQSNGISHIFKTNQGDVLRFACLYKGTITGSTFFSADIRNKFEIIKL